MTREPLRREIQDVLWRARSSGCSDVDAARAAGVSQSTALRWIKFRGGVKPSPTVASGRFLTVEERVEIHAGVRAGLSAAQIARMLGRHRSTICRELSRNCSPGSRSARGTYRALAAHHRAQERARRPKPRKIDLNVALRQRVQHYLDLDFSPEQVARQLRRDFGDDRTMTVSHEAIYQCIYINSAGGLRRELKARLRTGRTLRSPSRKPAQRQRRIPDMVNIVERPLEANGRAVPGHWEGDLIMGAKNESAVGTLVDRSTRFVQLLHLPHGHDPVAVRDEMIRAINRLPQTLRRSVTWDQGMEMRRHREITMATNMEIYFCDPRSPWQRPTNENTNGLLRQYLPHGVDLRAFTRDDLDAIEHRLNQRPRKVLEWRTPYEALHDILSQDQQKPDVASAP